MTPPHPAASRAKVVAAFLALYLIWGSTYLFIKRIVGEVPPLLTGALRNGIAGLVLFSYATARGAPRLSLKQAGIGVLVGVMLLGFGNGSVNLAMKHVPSGLTALIVSSVPIWMVIVDWLRPHGTRPSGRVIAGLALGFAGIGVLIVTAGTLSGTKSANETLAACAILLVGSISWGTGSIISRHAPRHGTGALATGVEMGAAGVVLFIASAIAGELRDFHLSAVSTSAWWNLAYVTVFGSIVGFSSYTWLLRVSTPAKVSTYAYVNPLVAVALGTLFGGEALGSGILAGAALILGAVVLITAPKRFWTSEPDEGPAVP